MNVNEFAANAPCGERSALNPPPASNPATVPVWAVTVSRRRAFGYSTALVTLTRTAERLA